MIDPTDPRYLDPARNELYKRKVVFPYLGKVMDNLRIEEESKRTLVEDYVASLNRFVDNPEESVYSIWNHFMAGFKEFASKWDFYNKLDWRVKPQKREDVLRERYETRKE